MFLLLSGEKGERSKWWWVVVSSDMRAKGLALALALALEVLYSLNLVQQRNTEYISYV